MLCSFAARPTVHSTGIGQGTPNDSSLLNALKTLFRVFGYPEYF